MYEIEIGKSPNIFTQEPTNAKKNNVYNQFPILFLLNYRMHFVLVWLNTFQASKPHYHQTRPHTYEGSKALWSAESTASSFLLQLLFQVYLS